MLLKVYLISTIISVMTTLGATTYLELKELGPEENINTDVLKVLVGMGFLPFAHWALTAAWAMYLLEPDACDEFVRNSIDKF